MFTIYILKEKETILQPGRGGRKDRRRESASSQTVLPNCGEYIDLGSKPQEPSAPRKQKKRTQAISQEALPGEHARLHSSPFTDHGIDGYRKRNRLLQGLRKQDSQLRLHRGAGRDGLRRTFLQGLLRRRRRGCERGRRARGQALEGQPPPKGSFRGRAAALDGFPIPARRGRGDRPPRRGVAPFLVDAGTRPAGLREGAQFWSGGRATSPTSPAVSFTGDQAYPPDKGRRPRQKEPGRSGPLNPHGWGPAGSISPPKDRTIRRPTSVIPAWPKDPG